MSDAKRTGCPLGLVILGVVLAIALHGGGGVKSPADTQRVLDELGLVWVAEGPPIVVFSNPG